MPFCQAGSIKYFTFSSLNDQGIYHALYTRHGGVSPTPWKSLNCGASVGDDVGRVQQNRVKALAVLDIDPESVYDTYQVHSDNVIITERPLMPGEAHIKADAIITNKPHVTLMMRFADCVPILLYDPVSHVIGIAHAGWIGTVNKIVGKTVSMMKQRMGTNPGDILAAIGPSIGPDHYSVGKEVLEKVLSTFGQQASELITDVNGKTYFDLWRANQVILSEVGVNKVEVAHICTNCNINDWFSHRGERGNTGRFGVILGLY